MYYVYKHMYNTYIYIYICTCMHIYIYIYIYICFDLARVGQLGAAQVSEWFPDHRHRNFKAFREHV